MQRHWAEVAPPAHLLIAAYVGFKPRKKGAAVETPEAFLQEMAQMFGPGVLS